MARRRRGQTAHDGGGKAKRHFLRCALRTRVETVSSGLVKTIPGLTESDSLRDVGRDGKIQCLNLGAFTSFTFKFTRAILPRQRPGLRKVN